MRPRLPHASIALFALATSIALVPAPVRATQIWSGYTFAFSKAKNADWTLPANQDHITGDVALTRDNTHGIYNIAMESAYGPNSPAGTEWATGLAANHASLTFAPWVTWAASCPPCTVGIQACLHLIPDDIYVDIKFDSWGESIPGGGAFAYHRGQPQVVPTVPASWGALKLHYR